MNKDLRVLTLFQPYATLLVFGKKKIETRPKPTNHIYHEDWCEKDAYPTKLVSCAWKDHNKTCYGNKGCPFLSNTKKVYLIHAAKYWSRWQSDLCLSEPFYTHLKGLGYPAELEQSYASVNGLEGVVFPLGQIIGSVEVIECRKLPDTWGSYSKDEIAFGNYTPGRYAWITQNPRILVAPILYKGGQGYYQKFKGDINQLNFIPYEI